MAVPTGLLQIILMSHRSWIVRWQNVVHPMTAGTVCRKGIATSIGEPVETVIVGLHLNLRNSVFFRNPLRRMTLWTRGSSDASLVDGRFRVDLCLDSVKPMASRASGRITPSPGRKDSMDTIDKLLGNFGVTAPARLRDVGTKDGGLGVYQGPDVMAAMTTRTCDLTALAVDASLE